MDVLLISNPRTPKILNLHKIMMIASGIAVSNFMLLILQKNTTYEPEKGLK
jgi:uncharacterized membrane protein YwzB